MKRLEDDGNTTVLLDEDTRELLAFFTGEKKNLGMREFL
jgi:hypothetical protein